MTKIVLLFRAGVTTAAMLAGGCAGQGDDGDGGTASSATSAADSSASTSSASSSASSTSGGMGGMTGAGGAAPMGWSEGPPALNNDADCLSWSSVSPAQGEDGHLYVARLTPPSYPFNVTSVHYELLHAPNGDTPCDAQAAHRVEVFVGSGTTPDPSPVVSTIAQPGLQLASDGVVVLKTPLPRPIALMQGEHLFVAVELPQLNSCILVCEGATATDRDYWSNATAAPYSWATLASFGITSHARIGAEGAAP